MMDPRENPKDKKDAASEFAEFMALKETPPPRTLSELIIGRVSRDLSPPVFSVLTKLALIHGLAGGATLLVCPQMGIGFTSGPGLMAWFMAFGTYGCHFACGAFFLGMGSLLGAALLSLEEVRVLKTWRWAIFPVLAFVWAAGFAWMGEGGLAASLLVWMMGAAGGAWGGWELVWRIRAKAVS